MAEKTPDFRSYSHEEKQKLIHELHGYYEHHDSSVVNKTVHKILHAFSGY